MTDRKNISAEIDSTSPYPGPASRFFEDWQVGWREAVGQFRLTKQDIIDFATLYDPQPYHMGDDLAAQTSFGTLIASGFQSFGQCFRKFIDTGWFQGTAMGGVGMENIRWLKPVFPDQDYFITMEVKGKKLSKQSPARGYVDIYLDLADQAGTIVCFASFTSVIKTKQHNNDNEK